MSRHSVLCHDSKACLATRLGAGDRVLCHDSEALRYVATRLGAHDRDALP